MKDLLKADFYRIIKSVTFYVLLGICVALPLITVLMVFGINKGFIVMSQAQDPEAPTFSLFTGKLLISGIYGLSSNAGLIIPIFLAIFVGGDISNGLLRNKILVGKSRAQIYFSHLIVTIALGVAFITISALIITPLTFLLVPYEVEMTGAEIRSIIFYYILGTFVFVFMASLVTMITLNLNHIVFPIVIVVLFGIGITVLTQLIATIPFDMFDKITIPTNIPNGFPIPLPDKIVIPTPFVKYLPCLIPVYSGNLFSSGHIGVLEFVLGLISLILFSIIFTLTGVFSFKSKEIK